MQNTTRETIDVMVHKRAAIYVRVSDPKQEKQGTSLVSQEEYCMIYCKEHSYSVDPTHIYREVHTGKEYRERPQMNALRAAARKGEFDIVVIYAYDRLARMERHQAVILDDLEHHSVAVEAVTESFDDTPLGRFMKSAAGFAAEVEREKILERTMRGITTRAQEGKLLGGGEPPYGYMWADPGRKQKTHYIPHPKEAPIVKRIFEMAADGYTLRSIALTLMQEKVPTRKDNSIWHQTTINQILRRLAYTGEAYVFREKNTREANGKPEGKQIIRERPMDEWIKLPDGVIPPLVDRATYDKVQHQLDLNKEAAARHNPNIEDSLLRAGLAKCGYCGCNLRVLRSNPTAKRQRPPIYVCRKGSKGMPGEAHYLAINADILDREAWEHAQEIIRDPSLVAQKLAIWEQEKGEEIDELAPIDRKIQAIEDEQISYLHMGKGITDTKILDNITREINRLANEKRALENDRKAVIAEETSKQEEEAALEEFKQWCNDVRQKLDDPSYKISYREKRRACEFLGIKVTLWREDHKPRRTIESNPPCIVSVTVWR